MEIIFQKKSLLCFCSRQYLLFLLNKNAAFNVELFNDSQQLVLQAQISFFFFAKTQNHNLIKITNIVIAFTFKPEYDDQPRDDRCSEVDFCYLHIEIGTQKLRFL